MKINSLGMLCRHGLHYHINLIFNFPICYIHHSELATLIKSSCSILGTMLLAAFFMQWQLHQFDMLKLLGTKHEYFIC
jgi:hypothetical protein